MTVKNHLKRSIEVIAHAATETRAMDHIDVLTGSASEERLRQGSQEQLNELAIPHPLLGTIHHHGWGPATGQQQLNRAVEIA